MPKKPSRKTLKDKADRLCREIVRARGFCELMGKDHITCGGNLQWAHIEGRKNHRLRWEPMNALLACGGHHTWYTAHPIAWAEVIREHFPERYEFVLSNRHEMWDRDYDALIARLQAQLAEVNV